MILIGYLVGPSNHSWSNGSVPKSGQRGLAVNQVGETPAEVQILPGPLHNNKHWRLQLFWLIIIAKLLYRIIPPGYQLKIWRWPDVRVLSTEGGAEIIALLEAYSNSSELLWKLGRGRIGEVTENSNERET